MKGSSSAAAAALTVVLAASTSTGASAFAPAGQGRASSGTALNLVPTQGPQLAAASSAAFARAGSAVSVETTTAKPSDPAIVNAAADAPLIEVSFETPTEAAAARGLVARLFSLPSIVRGSAGAAAAAGHPEMAIDIPSLSFERDGSEEKGDDVVLYPIVGFRWVKDGDGNSRVLPPMECNAACSLPNNNKEEEVHGWFSKACKLGSPHGSDEEYCSSPKP